MVLSIFNFGAVVSAQNANRDSDNEIKQLTAALDSDQPFLEQPPKITFINRSKTELRIDWLVDGNAKRLGRIAPESTLDLQTTIGHQFRIRWAEKDLSLVLTAFNAKQQFVIGDGSTKFQLHGWQVILSHELWSKMPDKTQVMLGLLSAQLKRIIDALPINRLKQIQKVKIWINPEYPSVEPTAVYHPDARWLRKNSRDPSMAKCVEITNVALFEFEDKRMPYMMLHELAHAYHDQVLGFHETTIREQFDKAVDSGIYDKVRRFTGKTYKQDRAYALTNHAEYFAESTEAFFGRNDFFPFDRKELKHIDPKMEQLLTNIWGEPAPQK